MTMRTSRATQARSAEAYGPPDACTCGVCPDHFTIGVKVVVTSDGRHRLCARCLAAGHEGPYLKERSA